MSGLVSYGMGSSDESESSDSEDNPVTTTSTKLPPQDAGRPSSPPASAKPASVKKASLFSSLPKPKSGSGPSTDVGSTESISSTTRSLIPEVGGRPGHSQGPKSHSQGPKKTSLFSSLPLPKKNAVSATSSNQKETDSDATPSSSSSTLLAGGTRMGGSKGFLNLPPPKKKQPVKISLPALPDPDSDDDEPEEKKPKTTKGAGLFSVLPKPRTASRKEANRLLIPYTLTKKPSAAPSQPAKASAQPKQQQHGQRVAGTISDSKPPEATPLVSSYHSDDEDDDDSSTKGKVNFFSMEEYEKDTKQVSNTNTLPRGPLARLSGGSVVQSGLVSQSDSAVGRTTAGPDSLIQDLAPPAAEPVFPAAQDQPLVFNPSRVYSSGYPSQSFHQGPSDQGYPQTSHASDCSDPGDGGRQDQTVAGGYQASESVQYSEGGDHSWQGGAASQSSGSQQNFLQDEGFARMVGKKNRGREEIEIIDIKADDQIGPTSGLQQMVKSMTEEKEYRGKLKKEQLPTSQQKRKHQITYLARQAKERELELKNQWADNRMTRKQTQAKYGF